MAASTSVSSDFGHHFGDPDLLTQALTHRSVGPRHNERLEFLGDALVGAIVAEALFARWPRADEGILTRARAQLVREASLATIARDLRLGERIVLGPGELKSGGQRRDSILADALEAVVAAIYLDAGYEACRAAVLPWFEPVLAELPEASRIEKDAKTRLQEWLQARHQPLPVYLLVDAVGNEHDKLFRVRCEIESPPLSAEGEAGSRRAAEQIAAEGVLAELAGPL